MKAKQSCQILWFGILAISLLLSGCSAATAPSISPTNVEIIEEAATLPPTLVPSVTSEPTQISYPFGVGTSLPALKEKITPENAADIIEVARWDIASIRTFTFAPDGQSLLIGTTNGNLMLVRVSDGELMQSLEGHTKSVSSVAYSSDGQFIISGSNDRTVRVWSVRDGSTLQVLEGHEDGVTSVAISPDGQTIASGSIDDTIRIWNFSDGNLLKTITGDFIGVTSLSFSPDGSTLVSGGRDDTARIWDITKDVQVQEFMYKPIGPGEVYEVQVDYSPDGTLLAVRHSFTGTMTLYNATDYSIIVTMPVPGLKNSEFVFSPDGRMLITGALDSGLNFVNIEDGTSRKQINLRDIKCVSISPDGTLVAVMGNDYLIHLWGLKP